MRNNPAFIVTEKAHHRQPPTPTKLTHQTLMYSNSRICIPEYTPRATLAHERTKKKRRTHGQLPAEKIEYQGGGGTVLIARPFSARGRNFIFSSTRHPHSKDAAAVRWPAPPRFTGQLGNHPSPRSFFALPPDVVVVVVVSLFRSLGLLYNYRDTADTLAMNCPERARARCPGARLESRC